MEERLAREEKRVLRESKQPPPPGGMAVSPLRAKVRSPSAPAKMLKRRHLTRRKAAEKHGRGGWGNVLWEGLAARLLASLGVVILTVWGSSGAGDMLESWGWRRVRWVGIQSYGRRRVRWMSRRLLPGPWTGGDCECG